MVNDKKWQLIKAEDLGRCTFIKGNQLGEILSTNSIDKKSKTP